MNWTALLASFDHPREQVIGCQRETHCFSFCPHARASRLPTNAPPPRKDERCARTF